jgi:hypothetical protein
VRHKLWRADNWTANQRSDVSRLWGDKFTNFTDDAEENVNLRKLGQLSHGQKQSARANAKLIATLQLSGDPYFE